MVTALTPRGTVTSSTSAPAGGCTYTCGASAVDAGRSTAAAASVEIACISAPGTGTTTAAPEEAAESPGAAAAARVAGAGAWGTAMDTRATSPARPAVRGSRDTVTTKSYTQPPSSAPAGTDRAPTPTESASSPELPGKHSEVPVPAASAGRRRAHAHSYPHGALLAASPNGSCAAASSSTAAPGGAVRSAPSAPAASSAGAAAVVTTTSSREVAAGPSPEAVEAVTWRWYTSPGRSAPGGKEMVAELRVAATTGSVKSMGGPSICSHWNATAAPRLRCCSAGRQSIFGGVAVDEIDTVPLAEAICSRPPGRASNGSRAPDLRTATAASEDTPRKLVTLTWKV
mmetsp:Transcript_36909/g.116060  ORF Transcript_36909/g.116060 Transcript_36909/m.116060 type:complete len:343 (+) Transcript_36909:1426-2454(+)